MTWGGTRIPKGLPGEVPTSLETSNRKNRQNTSSRDLERRIILAFRSTIVDNGGVRSGEGRRCVRHFRVPASCANGMRKHRIRLPARLRKNRIILGGSKRRESSSENKIIFY